jgi:hypothetical protein
MNKQIGIGILDIYSPEDLENCYSSIPQELKENVFVASNTINEPSKESVFWNNTKVFSKEVPFATLKNNLLAQMRLKDLKFLFLLHSNQIVKDSNIFENTIKMAETFGTWVILGPGAQSIPIEDDEANVTLHLTPELNDQFMFLYTGVVKNNGYFDERFYNTKNLDTLDYILKLRKKGIYPPNHYHPSIKDGLDASYSPIQKINFKDIPDLDRSVQLSYTYFMHNHQYIPGQNDPQGVTQEQLLNSVELIQKNYAKKNIV